MSHPSPSDTGRENLEMKKKGYLIKDAIILTSRRCPLAQYINWDEFNKMMKEPVPEDPITRFLNGGGFGNKER